LESSHSYFSGNHFGVNSPAHAPIYSPSFNLAWILAKDIDWNVREY
jgi:hypothetical protein